MIIDAANNKITADNGTVYQGNLNNIDNFDIIDKDGTITSRNFNTSEFSNKLEVRLLKVLVDLHNR